MSFDTAANSIQILTFSKLLIFLFKGLDASNDSVVRDATYRDILEEQ